MPQKPINEREPNRSRQDLWEHMMDLGTFTIKQLGKYTRIENSTIAGYLRGLEKAGYVTVEREQIRKNQTQNTYTVVRKSLDYPAVNKDGKETTLGRGTSQMWRSIRSMKNFTPSLLALHSSTDEVQVSVAAAKSYLIYLKKAGYVRVSVPSKPGTEAQYIFNKNKNTGSKAPKIQRVKQVFDPNLNKVVWPTDGETS